MKNILLVVFLLSFCLTTEAQELIYQTFKDTRVINSQSVETLQNRKLDVRIGHRFGDLAGDAGGWATFYGLENAADVFIGAEYGITDRLMVGISRTKGASALNKLVNPFIKYRILRQAKQGMPISVTAYGLAAISTAKKNETPQSLLNFQSFSHRVVYNFQFSIGRKFSDRFSLQLTPSWIHRNLVPFDQNNDLISLGVSSRIQLSRTMAFLLDITMPFDNNYTTENGYYMPIGIGFEFGTGGHIFQVNLTNARGMIETDYIPNTQSNWADGEFRLGFTISRLFNL